MSEIDLKQLSNLSSFAARVRYAGDHLKKLASGSARVVYEIDSKKVLKLAKNAKGLAQNLAEADGFVQQHYGDIIAKVLEYDNDDKWIVVERAKKISPSRFKALTGMKINILADVLRYWEAEYSGRETWMSKPEEYDEYMDNEFLIELLDMVGNTQGMIGDYGRISSYGEVDGRAVLTDYGLTQSVWEEHYAGEETTEDRRELGKKEYLEALNEEAVWNSMASFDGGSVVAAPLTKEVLVSFLEEYKLLRGIK